MKLRGPRLDTDLVALSLLLLMVLWFTHDMVWDNKVPFFRDLGLYFYPMRFSLAQSFKVGELPLWDRHVAMGFPLLADFQSGTFYLPHLFYFFLPFFTAVRVLFFFHYLVAAIGSYLVCRQWDYPPYLAMIGAIVFTFGGVIVSLTNLLNHFQSAVWLPWLIFAGERTFKYGRWRDFVGLIAVALAQFLAGSPEIYVMSMALLFLSAARIKAQDRNSRDRVFLLIVAANVLVIGLSMVQVLPTVELLLQSRRPGRIPYGETTMWSLNPLYLINIFFLDKEADANFFTGLRLFFVRDIPFFISYYMGQITLFGVSSWLYYSSRKEKIVLLGGILTTLILALGRHTPVYFYLFEYVPLFGFIRFPEKYFFLTYGLLIFIAIKGLHQFLENENDNRDGRKIPLFIVGLVLVFLSTVYVLCRFNPENFLDLFQGSGLGPDSLPSMLERLSHFLYSLERQILLLIAVFVLFLLYRLRKIGSPVFRALAVILVFMDLASAHRPYQFLFDPEALKEKPRILAAPDPQPHRLFSSLPYLHPSIYTFKQRAFGETIAAQWSSLFPNSGIFYGFDYLQETDALGRYSYDLFLRVAKDLPPNRFYPFLGALNVKYISSFTPLPDGKITLVGHFPEYPLWLYRVDRVVPRLYIVPKVVVEENPSTALGRLSSLDFDPFKEVILERPLSISPDKGFQAQASITQYTNQRVAIKTSLKGSGVLVLADAFYPGWRVYVDGKKEKILRANFFFRGVSLSAGEHLVDFRYEPVSFTIGLTVSLVTLCGFLFIGFRKIIFRTRATVRSGEGST